MRLITPALLLLLLTGCAYDRLERRCQPIARHLNPDLIDRHLIHGAGAATKPIIQIEEGRLLVDFQGRCLVTIGRGSSFFTEADYKNARQGFFAVILGDALFPQIGRRAYVAGIEQDIAIFTTTDGRFDVRVEPRGTPQPVDVVGVATELSELYDMRLGQR